MIVVIASAYLIASVASSGRKRRNLEEERNAEIGGYHDYDRELFTSPYGLGEGYGYAYALGHGSGYVYSFTSYGR